LVNPFACCIFIDREARTRLLCSRDFPRVAVKRRRSDGPHSARFLQLVPDSSRFSLLSPAGFDSAV